MNKTFIIIIALIAIVIGYLLLKAPTPLAPGQTVPFSENTEIKEFTIKGAEYSFSPSSITVQAGDRVKIVFQNIGNIKHNLIIQGLGVSTKLISSNQTDVVEFTAPSSGTYTIFCSLPGHQIAGMMGDLIVE
ncbi:MAG: cupredoxin domain-containing protein [Patescibacteria group bacterium]|nr:cupredoxin domain-containing protein [Patescibacteria group bacterium]